MIRITPIRALFVLAAAAATGMALTEGGRKIIRDAAHQLAETHVGQDVLRTIEALKSNPLAFGHELAIEIRNKVIEGVVSAYDHSGKALLLAGGTFAIMVAIATAKRMLSKPKQSMDENLSNVQKEQAEFLQLQANQYQVNRKRATLPSTGASFDYLSVGGTRWNYAAMTTAKGKTVYIKFSSLEALDFAINGDKAKPKNYNRKTFEHALALELPEDGDVLSQIKEDAKLSTTYRMLRDNLVKVPVQNGFQYLSPEFKIEMRRAGDRVIVEVNYDDDKKGNSVAYCGDTNLYMIRDVTDLVKDSNWNSVVSAFVMMMRIDPETRKSFIKNYFDRDYTRTGSFGYAKGRSDHNAETFNKEDFAKFMKVAKAFTSAHAAGGYLAEQAVSHIFIYPKVPTGLSGVVNRRPLRTGTHLLWQVKKDALRGAQFAELPLAAQSMPVIEYNPVLEFIMTKAGSPNNDILDLTQWKEHGVATLQSSFGISGVKRYEDVAHMTYFVYHKGHMFSNQASMMSSEEGARVAEGLRNFIATGGKVDELGAVFEIIKHGDYIMGIDLFGNVSVAPTQGNFDVDKMRFTANAASIKFTPVTAKQASEKLAAVRSNKTGKASALGMAATP